jgi:hypothetical protein
VSKLATSEFVTGMGAVKETESEGTCDVCLKAQQTRATFSRSSSRASDCMIICAHIYDMLLLVSDEHVVNALECSTV